MKKTKKLLACLIAAATMFTMGSTAFAAETVNKAQTPVEGKVQFTKEYKLIGEGNSPAETFNFTIREQLIQKKQLRHLLTTNLAKSTPASTSQPSHTSSYSQA